jgi:preprotein translocase subunit SecA
VLGTSLQEGERIELQLRGRAGRQGDPGTTQLMFDVGDPLIANFGMQSESAARMPGRAIMRVCE